MKPWLDFCVPAAIVALAISACNSDNPPFDVAAVPQPIEEDAGQTTSQLALVAMVESEPSEESAVGGHCALDEINGESPDGVAVTVGSQALFRGWAANTDGTVSTDMRLSLSDGVRYYSAPIAIGADRPDVAAALGNEAARFSGYLLRVTMSVDPGEYDTYIIHGGKTLMACSLNRRIAVTAAR